MAFLLFNYQPIFICYWISLLLILWYNMQLLVNYFKMTYLWIQKQNGIFIYDHQTRNTVHAHVLDTVSNLVTLIDRKVWGHLVGRWRKAVTVTVQMAHSEQETRAPRGTVTDSDHLQKHQALGHIRDLLLPWFTTLIFPWSESSPTALTLFLPPPYIPDETEPSF